MEKISVFGLTEKLKVIAIFCLSSVKRDEKCLFGFVVIFCVFTKLESFGKGMSAREANWPSSTLF